MDKAKLVLQINNNILEDEVISFNYLNGNKNITFTAKLNPTEPNEITASNESEGMTYLLLIANEITTALQNNEEFCEHYTVHTEYNLVTLKAKVAIENTFDFSPYKEIILPSSVACNTYYPGSSYVSKKV